MVGPAHDRAGRDRRACHREVLAGEGDVLFGPEPAYQLEELLRSRVPLGLVALTVPVRREVVLAGHDVDEQAAATELVQRGRRRREVRGVPVPGPDRHQWLERRRTGGQCGRDRQGVGTTPPSPEQGTTPPVLLGQLGQFSQPLQAVMPRLRVVPPMTRRDLIRDVPEKLKAHTKNSIPMDLLDFDRLTLRLSQGHAKVVGECADLLGVPVADPRPTAGQGRGRSPAGRSHPGGDP